jgi:Asp-tRNA(Asn)/Glu-tRNA(Gln) amidotransferase A subunit family amidase
LDARSKVGLSKVIEVPSRIYFEPSSQKPLAGTRVAIKDNYALAGIKTSLQGLLFQETYGAEAETAEYIRKLIDLGAVVVGMTKMKIFAWSEKRCDWVDFQSPFSP